MKLGLTSLFLVPTALFVTSCFTVGPDYVGPSKRVPDAWSRNVLRDLNGKSLEQWWKGFRDPTLNTLVERARKSNPDLKQALANIDEARALRGVARSQGLPQADASALYNRRRNSDNIRVGNNPAGGAFGGGASNKSYSYYSPGFDAGWEIDLFGGIRRSVEAASANVQAREEDYRDALVSLSAEVALNYVEYRALEERISVANSNIAAQRDSVKLTQGRFEAGLVPRIDVTQAESNLALSEAAVPVLRTEMTAAKNRLATLTGGFPASVEGVLAKSRGIPMPPAGYSSGLPADLLRARPDIRRAERELAAQTARIGMAEAELYPRLTLAGDFQLQSSTSGKLFDNSSRAYSFGPSFRWSLFSAGRIRNEIAAEESRAQAALAAYENSVLRAVEEVETAMVTIVNERQRLGDLSRAVASSRETVSLVKENYESGLVSFQNVLDAERTKFGAEDEEVYSRGLVARDYIVLFKALGGGTESEFIPTSKPMERSRRPRLRKKAENTVESTDSESRTIEKSSKGPKIGKKAGKVTETVEAEGAEVEKTSRRFRLGKKAEKVVEAVKSESTKPAKS